jgi:O-antigen/teichoic acid export membrane protein
MINSTVYFILLSVVASALNYFMYPLLGRILPPSDYVDITISISLFTQISTFLLSIAAITVGLSKASVNNNDNVAIEQLQSFLYKLFSVLAILFLLLSPIIMKSVNTPLVFVLPIILMMLFSIPITIISGYLNGKNLMVEFGTVILISASSQFIVGALVALLTNNAFLTMLSMTFAQIIAIILVYTLFSKYNLPKITNVINGIFRNSSKSATRGLYKFTIFASMAIMAINLVQVFDLFIMQGLNSADVKFYTDVYVISRVVFVAGMILIWPFLGAIDILNQQANKKPFVKLVAYFTALSLSAMIIIYTGGDMITRVLFGISYETELTRNIGLLSVLYKYFLLIITAVILYYVVFRNYLAIWISFATFILAVILWVFIDKNSSMLESLLSLNIIVAIMAILSIVAIKRSVRQQK